MQMAHRIRAVFRNGSFVPRVPCVLPDESEVDLVVHGPYLVPAEEPDPDKQREIMEGIIQRMQSNPLPSAAPRFTRDELHERR